MQISIAIRTLSVATLALAGNAQTLVRSVSGPAANAQFGRACIRVSDQNADGYDDLLVGAPGFNSQRGAIYCLSGAYLAFGSGSQTLWSLAPTANPGDLFGWALAEVNDVTGDGIKDFLVGQPGYDSSTANDLGAVRLVSGAAHTVLSARYGTQQGIAFGSAITNLSPTLVAIGAPGPLSVDSGVYVCNKSQFATSGVAQSVLSMLVPAADRLGTSIATGDFNHDGWPDLVAGRPGRDTAAGVDAGGVSVLIVVPNGSSYQSVALHYASNIAGERLGESVDAAHDYDGDGATDVVAGAPMFTTVNGDELGRTVVLSGTRLILQMPPYEIFTLTTAPGNLIGGSHFHFGASVRASADLNGDGVGEILVGAPDYFTVNPFLTNYGFAAVYSGSSGQRLATIFGAAKDHFGDTLAGALDDLDGDGFKEFVVAGALSDVASTDSGVVKCYRLFPIAPSTYCTGKLNSLGCTPAISFSGSPRANPTAPFAITATNFINHKNGLLFYSHAPTSAAFQGGFKCTVNPIVRTPPMNSGGAATGSSCTGTYSFDFNDWIVNGWDLALGAGAEIYAQYWSRDPQSASHTSLSNAVRFVINP